MTEIIQIKDLKVHYPIRSGFFNRITDHVLAVDGVDFMIEQGKTYGLVGESGSGKSTTGKAIIGLEKITNGEIIYQGQDVTKPRSRKAIGYNKDVQMIFQDSICWILWGCQKMRCTNILMNFLVDNANV